MMKRWITSALVWAIGWVCAPELSAAPTVAELAKLFAAGEKNTTPWVDSAREMALALKRANRQDLRIDYSFGLVLANQRRYGEAEPLLARYVAAHRDDWTAHTVKLWNEMQAGQFSAALDSMTELATRLSQSAADAPQAEQLAAVQFMGRCLAFLDRTPQKDVDDDVIAARTEQMRSLLGDRYRSALDEGWQSVDKQVEEMLAAQQERIDREHAKAAQNERKVNEDLSDAAKQIATQRAKGQSSLDTARDSQRELQNIRQQYASLRQDRTIVAAQITTIQTQITAIQNTPIVVSQGTTNTTTIRGANVTGTLTTGASVGFGGMGIESMAQLQSLSLALANLNKQAFDMDRMLVGLQARGAELAGISEVEFKKLSESQSAAEKAAKRAQQLSKQLDRPESMTARHSVSAARIARFSTYAPLPYEQETKRVLSWFEK